MRNRSEAPTVGLTASSRATEEQTRPYRAVLESLGARVVELRSGGEDVPVDALDGLLLSGGGDVEPGRFGQAKHTKTASIDLERDQLELRMARAALADGAPILGICRGAQVLGVALGGTLVQDVPELTPNALRHADAKHTVTVACGSRIGAILGCERLEVNSYHHQANDSLGDGVRAVAWSDDNVIEAIEATDGPFAIGVQWHPERMNDDRQSKLFAAFVSAAAERNRARQR
ncbi:MAG: gamma-glutamyl-gamma-aminobutyrate hydrolase family protein [Armatimonadota bacterium]|jgi:gamma-glutamyl-gamma-aminobutyrate hydrolase PuuD